MVNVSDEVSSIWSRGADYRPYSLIYQSHATTEISSEEVKRLCRRAQTHNKRHSITGFLHFHQGSFIQYLEGPQVEVLELMAAIRSDVRHSVTRLLQLGKRNHPLYPSWAMRYLPGDSFPVRSLEEIMVMVLGKGQQDPRQQRCVQQLPSVVGQ